MARGLPGGRGARPAGPAAARPDAPVRETDEPLVPLAGAVVTCPVYSWLGLAHHPGPLRLRAGVVARLHGDQHWAAAAGEPVAHYGECSQAVPGVIAR